MEKTLDIFYKMIQEDIEKLETEKTSKTKKMDKMTKDFHPRDIQKLDKLAAEINSINDTIMHFYTFKGSLNERLKSQNWSE